MLFEDVNLKFTKESQHSDSDQRSISFIRTGKVWGKTGRSGIARSLKELSMLGWNVESYSDTRGLLYTIDSFLTYLLPNKWY